MTKPITSIACLQLIEKGDLSADDPSYIEKYLPELWSQPILTGFDGDTPITTPRKTPLTLRHLLTHTSGLTYYFMSPLMAKWEQVNSHPSWLAKNAGPESLAQPLMFEPGTAYQYGISLDWAGVLVTRVTGQTLEDYFHQHIFGPSGLTPSDISFYPTEDIKSRLMQGYARAEDGSLEPTPGIRDPFPLTPEDIGLHLGGAGLLGTAKAYMAVSSEILAAKDGKSKVISKQVYDGLFTNAFPPRGETTAYEDLGKMLIFEGVTEEQFTSGEAVGHSLGLCLWTADSVDGQKAGSGFWGGAARTRFWIDPKSDIAVSEMMSSLTVGMVRYADLRHGSAGYIRKGVHCVSA